MTIGETYFFRDPVQFEVLRTTVLADVLQKRGAEVPLRFWSAGCATGEEAYSLAMLLEDCGLAERAMVLGSDVSSTAIDAAKRGQYGAWSFRHDEAGWRERCFVRTGKRWTIAAAHRRVTFMVHNLMQPAPASIIAAGGFDVILCRNVLLYFDRKTIERASHLLADALAPGGWLLMKPDRSAALERPRARAGGNAGGIAYRRPSFEERRGSSAAARAAGSAWLRTRRSRCRRSFAASLAPQVHAKRSAPVRVVIDAETHVARALGFLDESRPHDAAVSARRALFLDRSLAVAHLTLARALRLTGSRLAAQRALRRGAALLEAHAPDDAVRGAGGASAGTLCAVAAAEFDLLVGQPT